MFHILDGDDMSGDRNIYSLSKNGLTKKIEYSSKLFVYHFFDFYISHRGGLTKQNILIIYQKQIIF